MLINYGPSYAADLEFSNPWSKIFKCSHCCGLDLKREQRTRWTTLAVTDQQRELWRINERFTTFINNFSSWASSRAWVFRAKCPPQQTLLSFAAVRCSGCFSDLCVSRQLLEAVIDTDLKYRGEMLRYLGGTLILLMIRHGLDGSDRTNKLEN